MDSIVKLFPNEAVLQILTLFVLEPDKAYYQAAIVKETARALTQVQRSLERLEETGIITKFKEGNRVYYQANRSHPAFEDIKRVLFKTVLLGEGIREGLKPISHNLEYCFIYGSVASGNETQSSDIDIFMIGELALKEVSQVLSEASHTLNRDINPTIYSKAEFKKQLKESNPFIIEVIKHPKIWIFGEQDEFNKILK